MLQKVKLRNAARGREPSLRMLTSESRNLSAQIKSFKNQRFPNNRKVNGLLVYCYQEADWGV